MEADRYSRQTQLMVLGERGQETLARGHAVVVGCGALGSVCAELLARAGVGKVTVIDRDYVELSNLQRQFLFDEADAVEGIPKAAAAERRLRQINGRIEVRGVVDDLRPRNALELLGDAGVIVDATDNFEARYLINDFAVASETPWIYGAAVGTYGITMPVLPGESACFRCVYPERPTGTQPNCETAGVLGTVTALIASLEATAALQVLSGNRSSVRRTITTVDVWNGPLREVEQPGRGDDCVCCVERRFEWLDGTRDAPVSLCGRNAVQIHERLGHVDLEALRVRLEEAGEVRGNEFALRFARGANEITVFRDGRAIIKGTTDPAVARSLYAKWISA